VRWFAGILTRHARVMTWMLIGLTLVALVGATRLTIDPASTQLFIRPSDSYQAYEHFLATFGSDETLLVALHDPVQPIVRPEGLTAVRQLTQALTHLPQVATVLSLTNAPDMSRFDPVWLGTAPPPVVEGEALSAEQLAALQQNELVMGTLLSRDFHTAGMVVIPNQTITAPKVREAWVAAVRQVAHQQARQGRQTYVAGTPLERSDVTHYLERDQQLMVPLVFVVLLVITWSIYRITRFAIIPLICVLLSLIWTMGVIGFTGTPLNVVTSLLPPVVMVVSISVAIHVLNQFLDELAAGARGVAAVQNAVSHVGTACLLTTLTTTLGFFSLLVSPIPAMREFALFAGLGVLLSFVVSMACVPLALLRSGQVSAARLRHLQEGWIEALLDRLVYWVAVHRKNVFAGSALIVLALVPGAWYLTEGTDIVRALKPQAPLRLSTEFIDRHLTGAHSLEIVVQLPNASSLRDPATIRQTLDFAGWLRTQPGVTAVHGPWEPLRALPAELLAQDDQLTTLAALLPLAFPLDAWLNKRSRQLRFSARVRAMRSDQLLALADTVLQQAAHLQLQVQVTGSNYLLAQMSRTLVQTQTRTFGLATVLVLGSIALALRSWKLGCIAALPNLLPPLLLFGLMGWCGITLSTATTMIASVVLGLIVDDTIHLLHRYTSERAAGHAPLPAVERSLRSTGRALLSITLILTLGFWVGVLGSFQPTVHFSFLTGLTMILALVVELLMTPAVILTWDGTA
jgi:predicted RND superfamily exporter protein